ncbi:MAG TPA: hypothetical protein VMX55_08555 [candidate division Zixibacteria bacterium]|nr:hypothetical protein [candidate division Zixibacteria bacterium]
MTIEQYQETTQKQKSMNIPQAEIKKLRNNPLYKSRLSYIKEVILDDCPDINSIDLSDKLDISIDLAEILLLDCQRTEINK